MHLLNNHYVVVNNQRYYCKLDKEEKKKELIVEYLAKIVNINCAHYEYVNYNGHHYYLSEDLHTKGDFMTAFEVGLEVEEIYLYKIWDFIEDYYPQYAENLMKEYIKAFLFCFFILNSDFHSGNWGILMDDNLDRHLYILDNDLSFDDTIHHYITSEFYEGSPDIKYFFSNTIIEENMKNLDLFIKTSSQEFIDELIDMYEKLSPEVFIQVLDTIKNKYGLKDSYYTKFVTLYEANYQAISELLKSHHLVDVLSLK